MKTTELFTLQQQLTSGGQSAELDTRAFDALLAHATVYPIANSNAIQVSVLAARLASDGQWYDFLNLSLGIGAGDPGVGSQGVVDHGLGAGGYLVAEKVRVRWVVHSRTDLGDPAAVPLSISLLGA